MLPTRLTAGRPYWLAASRTSASVATVSDTSIQGGVENVELGGHVTDVLFSAGVLKLADPKGLDGTMSLEGIPKKGLVIDFENTQVTHAELQTSRTSIYSI